MQTQATRRTVLIVDDEESVRAALTASLELLGEFEIRIAPDGVSGLRMLDEARPDILLLDLVMPDIDGLQFLRAMRQPPRTFRPGTVVLMTALPDPFPASQLAEFGVDSLLAKPFQLRHLSDALRMGHSPGD